MFQGRCYRKGPVQLTQRGKIILHLTVKEVFETNCYNWRNGSFFIYSRFQLTMNVGLGKRLNCRPNLFFHLVVFAETVSTPCVYIRHLKSYVSQKFNTCFSLSGMNE